MNNNEERLQILERLESGELSPDEAAEFLQENPETLLEDLDSPMEILEALESGKISADQAANKLGKGESKNTGPSHEVADVEIIKERSGFDNNNSFWITASGIGITIMALSSWWMSSRLTNASGMDFWFFVAWFPFLIGLLLLVFAWTSKNSPWIRMRVRSKSDGKSFRFNLGFPIPKGILKWGIQRSSRFGTQGNLMEFEDWLDKLEMGKLTDPIIIHVDDDDEDVEIVIG